MDMNNKAVWAGIVVVVLLVGFFVWKKVSTKSAGPSPAGGTEMKGLGSRNDEVMNEIEGGLIVYFPG
ncbi:MAG: hypothetical protein ACREJQ_05065 [bacterium]